jgi:AraC family transcriptional regulator
MTETVLQTEAAVVTVEAELRLPIATVQIMHFHLLEPIDAVMHEDRDLRLDLCITARMPNARMSFLDRWDPRRFEKIGRAFLVPPRRDLRARSDGGRQASIVCQLSSERLAQWFGAGPEIAERQLEASVDVTSPSIQTLMLRLGKEARHPGFATDVLGEAMAVQIAVEVGRYFSRVADLPKTGGLAPWRLRLIDERLHDVRRPPTLAELAGLCSLSVRQLTRGFRVSRGCSIADYVAQSRIETAKRLLLTGESVKSVAYSMGFASPSSFCYAFRMATGESPRQFRQERGGAAVEALLS